MAKRRLSKPELLKKMGAYVLENGLSTASLRPLAQAAGTSDRMLIYHFETKESLITEVLQFLAQDFAQKLETALPSDRQTSTGAMPRQIMSVLRRAEFRPYIAIWLDIVASAAFNRASYRETGGNIADFFVNWIAVRLPPSTENPKATAHLMLTLIEGAHALDTVGRTEIADQAIAQAFPD